MTKEYLETLVGEVEASPALNVYLPHEWYSFNTSGWLYAIKKQPRVGIWTSIKEGDNVRIFQSEAARDAEIVRLEHFEQATTAERSKRDLRQISSAGVQSNSPALGWPGTAS